MLFHLPSAHFTSGCASSRRGLTLFELLLVMTILAILVSLVIGLGRYADNSAKRHHAIADLGKWQEALHDYYLFHNWSQFPFFVGSTNVSDLLIYYETNAGGTLTNRFAEHLTTQQIPTTDPWGNPYQYVAATNPAPQSFDLYSFGPDRQEGTSDDIRFQL